MWALIDQLVQQGVTDFFFGSGSRSTPLVMAAAHHPKATIHRHLDERGVGFLALGHILATERPAAIIATSGTAVGNLLPAVMEAHHSSLPLLLLTADRPSELRESSSNQTTDQVKIFSNFIRWQFDLDPSLSEAALRSKAANGYFRALFPHPGPVHLNCPIKDPVYPLQETSFIQGRPFSFDFGNLEAARRKLPSKGALIVGRLPKRADFAPIASLAKKLGWPIFADILSQGRVDKTDEMISHYDWLLDDPETPRPECIVHFGERVVSKRLLEWSVKVKPAEYLHVSPHGHWFDPAHHVTGRIASTIASACTQLYAEKDPDWLPVWQELDRQIASRLSSVFDEASFTESHAVRSLSSLVTKDIAVFLGTSMPIRESDWFFHPSACHSFYSNRGMSGIDGNIATAAGIAAGLKRPLLAFIGDLTALYDLNALALVKASKTPILLIISNNQGGGIYSHLPVAKDPRVEELLAFEHTIEFSHAAALFNLPFSRVKTEGELASAVQWDESAVIELVNSRSQNIAFHQQLKNACSRALV